MYIVPGNKVSPADSIAIPEGLRRHAEYEVLSVEGEEAEVKQLGRRKGKDLIIVSILPANVALYLMDKQADSLPELISWVRESPTERKQKLIGAVHEIVGNEAYLSVLMAHIGSSVRINDSVEYATEVADELLKRL